jgi:hypothetical protein
MAENVLKEKKEKKETGASVKYLRFLNGSFLTFDKLPGLLPFLIYITLIAIMLIANTYYAEKKIRQIEGIRNEVTELRTIYISNKSELMLLSNQSDIARRLASRGLVESTVPPRALNDNSGSGNFINWLLWRRNH